MQNPSASRAHPHQRGDAVCRLRIHVRIGVDEELQQPEVALLGRNVQRSDAARRRGVGVDASLKQQADNVFSDETRSRVIHVQQGGGATCCPELQYEGQRGHRRRGLRYRRSEQ